MEVAPKRGLLLHRPGLERSARALQLLRLSFRCAFCVDVRSLYFFLTDTRLDGTSCIPIGLTTSRRGNGNAECLMTVLFLPYAEPVSRIAPGLILKPHLPTHRTKCRLECSGYTGLVWRLKRDADLAAGGSRAEAALEDDKRWIGPVAIIICCLLFSV